jgi:hypothetical protein
MDLTILAKEKDNEIKLLKDDYALVKANNAILYELNQMYINDFKELGNLKIQNKILAVTTGVSISFALAELIGIGVFAALNYATK